MRCTRSHHIYFIILTILTVCFIGYHQGTFDQAFHIAFLAKYIDPSLFPLDAFIALRLNVYSFFWYLFIPFVRLGIFDQILFVLHVLSVYFLYIQLSKLSFTLFADKKTALITPLFFLIPHFGFAMFPLIEFSLLNRTVVLPFLVMAIRWYLEKKNIKSWMLLGILYNFHALSVNFIVGVFVLDWFIRQRKRFKNILYECKEPLFFLLFASPIFIWRILIHPAGEILPSSDWVSTVSEAVLSNIFQLFRISPPYILITISGICAFLIIQKQLYTIPDKTMQRTIRIFSIGWLCMVFSQQINLIVPIVVLVQTQIVRAGVFLIIFAYLFIAHYIRTTVKSFSLQSVAIIIINACSFECVTPYLLLHLRKLTVSSRIKKAMIFSVIFLYAIIATRIYVLNKPPFVPGIYISPRKTPWYEAQMWAKTHSPKDSVFLTPPGMWSWYESDWRTFSQRTSVGTIAELLIAAFDPGYTQKWKMVFDDIYPGLRKSFNGNYFDNQKLANKAYAEISDERLISIAKKYGITHIVTFSNRSLPLEKVFENVEFRIYKLKRTNL